MEKGKSANFEMTGQLVVALEGILQFQRKSLKLKVERKLVQLVALPE